jgi:hypothetical protein
VKKLKEGLKEKQAQKEAKEAEQRRKNFFQRKRFVNYEMNVGVGSGNVESEED